MKPKKKPYKIIGAYDSETTNYMRDGEYVAFPILHQLGILSCPIEDVNAENVEDNVNIELYRHSINLYARFDALVNEHHDYVPVIMCHNLSFDFYGLSGWLERYEVKVLAKSARKPISFTILGENGEPLFVIWDTLIFSQQSLERMGKDCGYAKQTGAWDYDLLRTPETPLTDDELSYAKRDVYALIAWVGWWIRRNPDIDPSKLGFNVVTKTGIVRERRNVRFASFKKQGQKKKVGDFWLFRADAESPKSDDELFTMLAATRGGLTFCSSVNASVPFDLENSDDVIAAYDATSQHPAQMVSHLYPTRFHETTPENLELAFELVSMVSPGKVRSNWCKPFPVAFNACFEFENLRPKPGTAFEKFGVMPLASARYRTDEQLRMDLDNGDRAATYEHLHERAYQDTAANPVSAFGKLVCAGKARLYLTELAAWEVCQAYEWDAMHAIHGYMTGRFSKPSDMDVISVMQFYKAKNAFKSARHEFYERKTISNADELKTLGVAPALVDEMVVGSLPANDVEAAYLGLKADLNSLYGINCCNEYRRDTVLGKSGIEYQGEFGICNRPKHPKVWYQFGQRIVGWSRIAQIMTIYALEPYAKTVINGDTDSIKIVIAKADLPKAEKALDEFGKALDEGKRVICSRVKAVYPQFYDPLDEIGYYICELVTDRFCASWNKAYCTHEKGKDGNRHFEFTLAGIPTRRREHDNVSFIGINGLADRLHALGVGYETICNTFLGYNVTFAHDVIRLNNRAFPEWGACMYDHVTDYRGMTALVAEPQALALFPMAKTVNDTGNAENAVNLSHAKRNNPHVNTASKLITANGIIDWSDYE